MPWHVGTSDECPESEPHAVIKDDTGEVVGCHATVDEANDQLAALNASEADESSDSMQFTSETPWEGLLIQEGVETGDGREFVPNSLTWDTPPLPLRWNVEDSHGGMPTTKTVLVGRIDMIFRDAMDPTKIMGAGVFDDAGVNGAEALRLVKGKFLKGVSIDADNIKESDIEFIFPEGTDEDEEMFMFPEKMIFHAGRIRAATLVDIPAAVDAQIQIKEMADDGSGHGMEMSSNHYANFTDQPWDGAGVERSLSDQSMAVKLSYALPHPNGNRLGSKFLHHELDGRANINACVAAMRRIQNQSYKLTDKERWDAYSHISMHLKAAGHKVDPLNIQVPASMVASTETLTGPAKAWFETSEPDGYMPITVTDEVDENGWRRFYGHGAAWNSCHTGFANVCRTPPREGEHSYFRLGEIVTKESTPIAVGTITMGIGHAPTVGYSAISAIEHYDNTETVIAYTVSYEGKHGIWLSGVIPPWVTAERVAQFRGAGQVSGDWRSFGGKLRLIAFLVVNTPGFPIPRLSAGVEHGKQRSLVAAGMMPKGIYPPMQMIRGGSRDIMKRIAASIGRDDKTRMNELIKRVKG